MPLAQGLRDLGGKISQYLRADVGPPAPSVTPAMFGEIQNAFNRLFRPPPGLNWGDPGKFPPPNLPLPFPFAPPIPLLPIRSVRGLPGPIIPRPPDNFLPGPRNNNVPQPRLMPAIPLLPMQPQPPRKIDPIRPNPPSGDDMSSLRDLAPFLQQLLSQLFVTPMDETPQTGDVEEGPGAPFFRPDIFYPPETQFH